MFFFQVILSRKSIIQDLSSKAALSQSTEIDVSGLHTRAPGVQG